MQSPITISMWPGNRAAGRTAGHVATMTRANAGSPRQVRRRANSSCAWPLLATARPSHALVYALEVAETIEV